MVSRPRPAESTLIRIAGTFRKGRATLFADGAALALAAPLIFLAPYWFPPSRRLVSPSYAFGFNNRIAVLSLALIVFILALARAARRRMNGARAMGAWDSLTQDWRPLVRVFGALALWYLLLTTA